MSKAARGKGAKASAEEKENLVKYLPCSYVIYRLGVPMARGFMLS